MKRRNSTGIISIICGVFVLFAIQACEGTEQITNPQGQTETETETEAEAETSEDVILAVQDKYTIHSIVRGDNYWRVTFADPQPVTVKQHHPAGIDRVVLYDKEGKLTEGPRYVDFSFRDKKTARISKDTWIVASLDTASVSFDPQLTSRTIRFTIEDAKPETVNLTVSEDNHVSSEVSWDKSGKGGTISFKPKGGDFFSTAINVHLDNGAKSCDLPVSLWYDEFMFLDGTISKSYDLPEFEREWAEQLSTLECDAEVVIPEECSSWITTSMEQWDHTVLYILIGENTGDARDGEIRIYKKGTERFVSVKIHQKGYNDEGCLRKGLEMLYTALDGPNWPEENRTNWCSDRPLHEWSGVRCLNAGPSSAFDLDHDVYSGTEMGWTLDLNGFSLHGTIPDEFWKAARYFTRINFHNTTINKSDLSASTIPDWFWNSTIKDLDMVGTYINVQLNASIAKATNLKLLNLNGCSINGPIPAELAPPMKLQELSLSRTGLTGEIPASVWRLTDLRELDLSNNDLHGELPAEFYNMTKLQDFEISYTKIGGTLTKDIAKLVNLKSFCIVHCEFRGTIPEEFGTLKNLGFYLFMYNHFTAPPQFPRYIGICTVGTKRQWTHIDFPDQFGYWQFNDAGETVLFPTPVWANVKFGICRWCTFDDDERKYPEYPYSDDLQYPGYEYYWDGENWRHPKLEYPVREYWFDGTQWLHDASCPWEQPYHCTKHTHTAWENDPFICL